MNQSFDDVAFLKQKYSGGWPCWPYCPVKKYTGKGQMPLCGLVMDTRPLSTEGGKQPIEATVYVGLMVFKPWTKQEFEACEKKKYDSIEALVADGWMVD